MSPGILIPIFFQSYLFHKIRPILLGILFFGIGIILHFYNTSSFKPIALLNEEQSIVFRISQKLNSTERYRKYIGEVQLGNKNLHSIIYLPKNNRELDFVHYYKTSAYVFQPKSPQYDFQFDYAQYLKRRNIQFQSFLSKEISSVESNDVSFIDRIRQYRMEVLQKIDQSKISAKTKEFLKGIILADRTETDYNIQRDFNKSGLVHLLAISGTHIVVIFGMFYFLMVRLVSLRLRPYVIIFSLIFIWLFAGFIGFGNSVMRACIMLNVYYVFILLQRKPDLLHSLALSVFIILILDTQQLFDVGFQLSYLAVLGIFWLNQPLLKYFPKQDHYLKKLIYSTITISLSAQLATLPLVLYYFHQFSLISIIANFIIVPFSEIIIVLSFLMTIILSLSIDIGWISKGYDFVIQVLLKVIHWFAEIDMLFFENIPMGFVEVLSILVMVYRLRFVILKFNFKNSMRFIMVFFVFLMVKSGYCIGENRKAETLLFSFEKSKVFLLKQGSRVCFWTSDNADQRKVLQFIVKPYCSSRRIDYFDIKTFPSSAQKVVFMNEIYNIE
nr:ComEC/Rec2 family competence protein [uncultured Chryseobacterium sp.]